MRLIDNGKICAVNAKEQARLRKWENAQERKKNKGEKSKTLKGSETNA